MPTPGPARHTAELDDETPLGEPRNDLPLEIRAALIAQITCSAGFVGVTRIARVLFSQM
jgi:hypothetical protein